MRLAGRYQMGVCAWVIALSMFYPLICPYGWFLFPHMYPFIVLFWVGALISPRKGFHTCFGVKAFSIAFILYLPISYCFIGRYEDSEKTIAFHIVELITLIVFLSFPFKKRELHSILAAYELAGDAIVLKMLIQHAQWPGSSRYTIFNFGHKYDPNFLAASLIAPILLSFYRCLKNGFTLGHVFRMILLLAGVLATGSRGAMLALLIGGFILLCSTYKLSLRTILRVFILLLVIICAYLLLPMTVRQRFSVESLDDGSNHLRLFLWKIAWRVFMSNPLWGRGSRCIYDLGPQFGGISGKMSHNIFLEILTDYGLFGFTLLGGIMAYALLRSAKRKEWYSFSMLLATLCAAVIVPGLDSGFFWVNLMLAFVVGNPLVKREDTWNLVLSEMRLAYGQYHHERLQRTPVVVARSGGVDTQSDPA